MLGTQEDNSCRIGRRADYQGSRPPVDIQAGVEKMVTGPSSSVVHQADEGAKATGYLPLNDQQTMPTNTDNATMNNSQDDSLISTLEPYTYSRRNRRNRTINLQFNPMPFNETHYKKFFVIKLSSEGDLRNIDIISANKELERQLGGRPERITELNNGTFLIEVTN